MSWKILKRQFGDVLGYPKDTGIGYFLGDFLVCSRVYTLALVWKDTDRAGKVAVECRSCAHAGIAPFP